jgi:hypothetical protein
MALVLLEVLSIVLVALAMTPALAHALEMPGKLRLSREEYLVVQPIYHPGFTRLGIVEPAAAAALLVLALLTPAGTARSWLTIGALAAVVAMHALYWILTHPVNNFWLRDVQLGRRDAAFFDAAGGSRAESGDWRVLRDCWERSHLARAALAAVALVLTAAAVAL